MMVVSSVGTALAATELLYLGNWLGVLVMASY